MFGAVLNMKRCVCSSDGGMYSEHFVGRLKNTGDCDGVFSEGFVGGLKTLL